MICLGDLHGNFQHLIYTLSKGSLDNTNVIQVGDFGIGFLTAEKDIHNLHIINEALKIHNCKLYILRGNHDDPSYFKGDLKNNLNDELSNIVLIEDYEVHEIEGENVFFVGGGISIDRKVRTLNKSYWKDEAVKLNGKKMNEIKKKYKGKKIDIIITHSAPMWCNPKGINDPIVRDWCSNDLELSKDLIEEREDLATIFDEMNEEFKFKFHIYGHFHKSYGEKIVDCQHIVLGIGKFFNLNKYKENLK